MSALLDWLSTVVTVSAVLVAWLRGRAIRQLTADRDRYQRRAQHLFDSMSPDAQVSYLRADAERAHLEATWRLPTHKTAGRRDNAPGPASPQED